MNVYFHLFVYNKSVKKLERENKMKRVFLSILSISMLAGITSCSIVDTVKNKEFGIAINDNYPQMEEPFYTNQKTGNYVSLEMNNHYNLIFYVEDEKFDLHRDDIEAQFTFDYPQDKFDIRFAFSSAFDKCLQYYLYTEQLFSRETINITYENEVYSIDVQSIDYNFSKGVEIKPSAASLEQDFSEFKEMMDSIQYHSFVTPFPGRNPSGYYSDENEWNDCQYHYDLQDESDTSYVDYLIDSVYYPTHLDFADPNIVSKDMHMVYEHSSQTMENASPSTMGSFCVGISVIDPGCTKPTNPLHYLFFEAYPLQYEGDSERIQKNVYSQLHSQYYLLSKAYPESYLSYEVGDIALRIIQIGSGSMQAFFEDDTYAYVLAASYDR